MNRLLFAILSSLAAVVLVPPATALAAEPEQAAIETLYCVFTPPVSYNGSLVLGSLRACVPGP